MNAASLYTSLLYTLSDMRSYTYTTKICGRYVRDTNVGGCTRNEHVEDGTGCGGRKRMLRLCTTALKTSTTKTEKRINDEVLKTSTSTPLLVRRVATSFLTSAGPRPDTLQDCRAQDRARRTGTRRAPCLAGTGFPVLLKQF